MASFRKETFDIVAYASFRPSYPKELLQLVYEFHQAGEMSGKWGVAVDLGCGTGQATEHLDGVFRRVIGVDKSEGMVRAARKKFESGKHFASGTTSFSFERGDAANLCMINDETVDLVISAEACHWFDWRRTWPEIARILRPGGSAVHWIYAADFVLPDYPTTAPLIKNYAERTLWNYFEQPGITILKDMLTGVPEPPNGSGFSTLERRYYCGWHFPSHLPKPQSRRSSIRPVIMGRTMRWRDLLGYFRTWSALHTFHQKFPDDLNQFDGRFPEDLMEGQGLNNGYGYDEGKAQVNVDVSGGDIAVRFWKDLRELVKDYGGKCGVDDLVRVEWPVTMLLVKKDACVTTTKVVRSRL